jgi:Cu/Ag efflux protein CusF
MKVNFIARKFRTLFFLVLIVGLAGGAVMASRGMQVNLGSVAGHKLVLAQPTPRPAAVAAPSGTGGNAFTGGAAAGGAATGAGQPGQTGATAAASGLSGAAAASGRPMTGTVQKVDGTTITVTQQDGTVAKAVVSNTTTFVKDSTMTAADIKVGDTVAAVGQTGVDGSIAALQVTDGNGAQAAAAGGFARQGGAAAGGTGGQGGAAVGGTGGAAAGGGGRPGGAAAAGQFAGAATANGTVQKIDGQSLTITEQSGQTVVVTISTNTRLRKATTAVLADVAAGDQVTIIGQTGSDGSIAATVITITAAG